jgi:two-component system OmpR family response regulator
MGDDPPAVWLVFRSSCLQEVPGIFRLPVAMRLLVVEDEPDLLSGLARALRREGYAVDTAVDGEEGLYKATSTDYDAILLDLQIPKLDGWALLSRLREVRSTPVLVLTARDALEDRVRGLDGGADDYLVKPFDMPELMARLRAVIRRGARQARAVVEVGNLEVDTASRTVRQSGNPVPLTAREYVLLEYLVLHRGEVVSRTELYEHLFDENDATLSNLLDVHVSNLRRKLGPDLIQTRRGLGYAVE